MPSHVIDIEECPSGSHTKVRTTLNEILGGPEFWEYDKPLFSIEASDEDFEDIQEELSDLEGVEFLPDHHIVTEVEEDDDEDEEEEEEEEDEEEEAEPEPEPELEPEPEPEAEDVEPAEVIDYSVYRC